MRSDLGKHIGNKDVKVATLLELAVHLEAVTRIEEKEQTPKNFRRAESYKTGRNKKFSGGRHQAGEPIACRFQTA